MALSTAAEAKIRALVLSGISFSNHVQNSDHFDEDSAYASARDFGRGADGLGPCSFFVFDDGSEPGIHRSTLRDPGAFTGKDADGWNLGGKALAQARNAHKAAVAKFQYRTAKDNLRQGVETDLQNSWDANGEIDKHALIKAFLLSKKSTLNSAAGANGRIIITGYIPWGFAGYIIPAGVPKRFDSYEYTDRMTVVIGGGGGNPQVVTAYPSH